MATNDDDEQESFMIEDELCRQIADDTPQNGDIKIIKKAEEEEEEE